MEIPATLPPETEKFIIRRVRRTQSVVKKTMQRECLYPVLVSIAVVVSLQLACLEGRQPSECSEYFSSGAEQDETIFIEYELEKQLVIYRCGLDQHPPVDYSHKIARRGRIIIPELLRELDETGSYEGEKKTYAIIHVFEALAAKGELKDAEWIVHTLEENVSKIRTNWIRTQADKSMSEIKSGVAAKPNTVSF